MTKVINMELRENTRTTYIHEQTKKKKTKIETGGQT